jgi:hypothetical protein
MRKLAGAVPVLLMVGAITMVPACASQQAEHTTNEITDTTADTTSCVFSGLESIILYPFRLVGDLFS